MLSLALATLPWAALAVFVIGTALRLAGRLPAPPIATSFLERRLLFLGVLPLHVGLAGLLAGHLFALSGGDRWQALTSTPARLLLLDAAGIAFALLCAWGLLVLAWRRAVVRPIRAAGRAIDWLVLALLLAQVATGAYGAIAYRSPAAWSAVAVGPWLAALVRLAPDTSTVASLPLPVGLHVAGGWLLLALLPFSRLFHAVELPVLLARSLVGSAPPRRRARHREVPR